MSALHEKLKLFYAEVDARAQFLEQIHAARLNCRRGCSSCCVDGITVWNIEADNIRQTHNKFLNREKPNENEGYCAFLGAHGECRIYSERPYVCRTQGLPLRWFDEMDEEIYELRDICPLNENGEPVENLRGNECWTIGSFEEALAELENEFDNGSRRRTALRDLFASK